MQLPASFAQMGFDLAPIKPNFRLLIASEGHPRSGKSEFYLSAPEPIAVIEMDHGTKGMIEKHIANGRAIGAAYIKFPPPQTSGKIDLAAQQKQYEPIWLDVQEKFKKMVKNADARTLAIDTGTEFWNLLKLAVFGSLNPRGDLKTIYPQVNRLYKSLIEMVHNERNDLNLIMTHKYKESYKKNEGGQGESWDGTYKRSGFNEKGYLIQINIRHTWTVEEGFVTEILDCKQNMDIAGMKLYGKESNFMTLGQMIYPDSTPADWGYKL
jgi:hypothetical protein